MSGDRFLYYVRRGDPGTSWEVAFGLEGSRFTFPTQDEALAAAKEAAQVHWAVHHEPSGVYLIEDGGRRRLVDYYGSSATSRS